MDEQKFEGRLKAIVAIWESQQWLYAMVGFLLGMLVVPLLTYVNEDSLDFLESLVPEALGITFTVLFINTLDRRRDKRQRIEERKQQLTRDVGNQFNPMAINAIRELSEKNWLQGKDGVLQGKDLSEANLQGANLVGANLSNTILKNANLRGAKLNDADLTGAVLFEADLEEADLSNAHLEKTNLSRANLVKARIIEAHLHEADLSNAVASMANFSLSNLTRANLSIADLDHAVIISSELNGADLRATNLSHADLSNANLVNAKLRMTRFNQRTALPDNIFWSPQVDMTAYNIFIYEGVRENAVILGDINTVFDDAPVDIRPDADISALGDTRIDETQELERLDLDPETETEEAITIAQEERESEWTPDIYTVNDLEQFDEHTTLDWLDAELFEAFFDDGEFSEDAES